MTASRRPSDAVPLGERLRVLQALRAAGVGLLLLCATLAPEVLAPGRRPAVVCTLLYVAVVLLAEAVTRLRASLLVPVFSGLLIVDGLWLTWTSYLTGGVTSPLRYLLLLHLAAVALVASYRTGLKIALWDSLLLWALHEAVRGGSLTPNDAPVGSPTTPLVVFVTVLWLVAIATAALSAVNERELRRQRLDLEALNDLAEQLERSTEPLDVARTLLDATVTGDFLRGVVVAGPEGQLDLLAGVGVEDGAGGSALPGPSAAVDRAQQLRAPVLVRGLDPVADPWLTRLLPGAHNLVVVPLSAEGRAMGALVLEHAGASRRSGHRRLERRVLAGLERSAAYTALALRNAWLVEQLRELASTDGLTKIANRRTFEATLEREVARAARSGDPVSLVMLDIDHFKRLNDSQGHPAGDEVLRGVAAVLSRTCREFDMPARYGGEEFAVVMPGCGPEEAGVIGERFRRAVSSAPSRTRITASAGVASYPAHADGADTLVRAADEALYQSKDRGRDRTTCANGVRTPGELDELLQRAISRRSSGDAEGDSLAVLG